MTNSEKVANGKHEADATRLPKCITGWQQIDPKRLWNDGTQILVAVPVSDARWTKRGWYYEYSVVVIRCDEDFFDIETPDGDAWGWDLDSVDFYVILSE